MAKVFSLLSSEISNIVSLWSTLNVRVFRFRGTRRFPTVMIFPEPISSSPISYSLISSPFVKSPSFELKAMSSPELKISTENSIRFPDFVAEASLIVRSGRVSYLYRLSIVSIISLVSCWLQFDTSCMIDFWFDECLNPRTWRISCIATIGLLHLFSRYSKIVPLFIM